MNVSTLAAPSNSANEATSTGATYEMPATPLQVRLWKLSQSAGPDAAWNVAVRFRLNGPVDRVQLESSLQWLATRHESLRTSLGLHDDVVIQRIAPQATLPVEWCDLRSLDLKRQTEEVERLSLEHAREPMMLDEAPLFRVRILRLKDDEHVLLWKAHHAICDGWSIGLLSKDLMDCYGKLATGAAPIANDALDYGDYSVWLEAQRKTSEYEHHRSYWVQHLQEPTVAELPPVWRNLQGAGSTIVSELLPRTLTDRLSAVAKEHEATFFHAAFAAFAMLLRAQQPLANVALGIPFSGREQPELEGIVGTFVNYVPLRVPVEQGQTYAQLLHSVRDLVGAAAEHSQFRFEDLPAERIASGASTFAESRLFSAAFICQQDFVRPLTAGGVTLTAMPSVSSGALRPLTVFMVERAEGWRLSCEVDDRIVSAAAGSALLKDFERLLGIIGSNPQEQLATIAARAKLPEFITLRDSRTEIAATDGATVIPATEFQRRFWQLNENNQGAAAFHIRVRMEMTGTLDVEAFRSAVKQLVQRHEILRTTFEQKEDQIRQVIHRELPIDFQVLLSSSATSAGSCSAEQQQRDLALLNKDGNAPFSLTEGPLFRIRLLQLEPERYWLAITLSHGIVDGWSMGIFLEELQKAYEQSVSGEGDGGDESRARQFSYYAAAEQKLLLGLENDRRMDWWSKELAGVWKPLALPRDLHGSSGHSGDLPAGLEVAELSEEITGSARRFARETETTLFSVFGALFQAMLSRYSGQKNIFFLTPHANRRHDTESILGPLAEPICVVGHLDDGTTFRQQVERFAQHSMDAMDNALPLNVVAPLLDMREMGGYHPLNQIIFFYQRAFVDDMQWSGVRLQCMEDAPSVAGSEWQLGVVERGSKMFLEFQYDRTRYSQEKIRAVIRHFETLLANAVAEPDTALSEVAMMSAEEIEKEAAAQTLAAMDQSLLKSAIANQEIKNSPAISLATSTAAEEMVKPQLTQTERDILRIWQRIFKIEDLDATSDFFDLGGHSLLLARLQIAMKKEFKVSLTAADVFRHPTIATLAEWLERARSAGNGAMGQQEKAAAIHNSRIVPIQTAGSGRPIFVISQSMIFRTLAAELGADQPVYAVQMLEQDAAVMESATYEELIDFYVRLIREEQPQGPYRLAGWCVSGWIAYGVACRLEQEGAQIEMLMIIDAWAPGYWSGQPPIRKRIMFGVYQFQRSRWVSRRLRQASTTESGKLVAGNLRGLAATAEKIATRFRRKQDAVDPIEIEELRRNLQMQRAAGMAAKAGPLHGKVIFFRSEEEPKGPLLAPDMGWGKLLGRAVPVEGLPGDHHEIFDLPGARKMALSVSRMLGFTIPRSSADLVDANANKADASEPSFPLARV